MALNANRHVTGVMRGFDQFMNIVLDNAVDEKAKTDIGMVVSPSYARPIKLASLPWRVLIDTCLNSAGGAGQQHRHNRGFGQDMKRS